MRKSNRQRKGKKKVSSETNDFLDTLRKKLGVRTLLEVKHLEIRKALAAAKGDNQLAAALLGIGKTSLYRFLANQAD
jgi:transcriptional regulator with PAS, ATPase and Fis domain